MHILAALLGGPLGHVDRVLVTVMFIWLDYTVQYDLNIVFYTIQSDLTKIIFNVNIAMLLLLTPFNPSVSDRMNGVQRTSMSILCICDSVLKHHLTESWRHRQF
jgi:hypothetical protein